MTNRSGGVPAGAVQIEPAPAAADAASASAGAAGADSAGLPNPDGAPAAASNTAKTPDILAVYITGAVISPGVYRAPAGQRLDDLLALAGGPADNAALERVNLAAYLADAAHYRIPAIDEAPAGGVAVLPAIPSASADAGAAATAGGMAGACASPVNINTADAPCLETLPTIGPARAVAIVTHRRDTGPFTAAADITAVPGIGDGTYQRIAGLITIDGY